MTIETRLCSRVHCSAVCKSRRLEPLPAETEREGATESKTRKHQVCNKDSQITSLDLRGKVLRDVPEDVRRQMLNFQEPLNFR